MCQDKICVILHKYEYARLGFSIHCFMISQVFSHSQLCSFLNDLFGIVKLTFFRQTTQVYEKVILSGAPVLITFKLNYCSEKFFVIFDILELEIELFYILSSWLNVSVYIQRFLRFFMSIKGLYVKMFNSDFYLCVVFLIHLVNSNEYWLFAKQKEIADLLIESAKPLQ